MPVKQVISLKDISSVAASGTVVINCPLGYRYHQIFLQHGYASGTNTIAAAMTNLTEIKVKLNNRIQRRYISSGLSGGSGGTSLRDQNLFHGTQYDCLAGGVPNTAPGVGIGLFFAEPWRKDVVTADSLAWATAGMGSFQVEVTLGAASTPTLVAWAVVDEVAFDKPQMITKILPFTINASGTKFDYVLADQTGFLTQLTLYPDTGGTNALTPLTLRSGPVYLFEAQTQSAERQRNANSDMYPAASGRTANLADLVLDADDLIGSAPELTVVRDKVLTIEAASAMSGTITGYVHRIGYPE